MMISFGNSWCEEGANRSFSCPSDQTASRRGSTQRACRNRAGDKKKPQRTRVVIHPWFLCGVGLRFLAGFVKNELTRDAAAWGSQISAHDPASVLTTLDPRSISATIRRANLSLWPPCSPWRGLPLPHRQTSAASCQRSRPRPSKTALSRPPWQGSARPPGSRDR